MELGRKTLTAQHVWRNLLHITPEPGRSAGLATSQGSNLLAPCCGHSSLLHGCAFGLEIDRAGATGQARRARRSLDSSPTRARAVQNRTLPQRPAALPPLPSMLGGEDVRAGFMARSRSLARFSSRCTGTLPGAKPSPLTGILQLRASGIIRRPSRTGKVHPASVQARAAALGAPCSGRKPPRTGRGTGRPSNAVSRGIRLATPAPWRCLRHPPHGNGTNPTRTGVMWSKLRQTCCEARVLRPNSR